VESSRGARLALGRPVRVGDGESDGVRVVAAVANMSISVKRSEKAWQ
jgi:hypothetical protein